ncbi:MAG: hypothetical protein A2W91_10045 [Bacteroidetes bacterium GWF2_38_335]|nr:MAG: hypothetical protein A2W91_10045 [Bacteroidetes bacterium GWF2_38_335]HBS88033.1 hybrid sensor histidine kinase/response regulator [Bacteroidales bacterium]
MNQQKKPLILIIDDMPANIQVLGNILYEKGYNINISSSGTHALQSVKVMAPDLILLDIQMPGMDGYEVCKILKTSPRTYNIPIIFLTSITEPENILKGFELGAVDFITKPFNALELTARVATHIELKLSKEKLLEINATKDKFFSIIAHDLKNPFAALMVTCDLMKRSIVKKDMKEVEKIADLMQAETKETFKLLENLLNWSKLQLGIFEAKKEKFNIHDIVLESIGSLQSFAAEKKIKLTISNGFGAYILFDLEMFKTIIRNLVTNAIKFSNKGDNVLIEISSFDDDKFKISIKDTGTGISADDLIKIFQIETKFSNLGTNNERGSGLGLLLCKEFVEKNGAELQIESELGKGSSFNILVSKMLD